MSAGPSYRNPVIPGFHPTRASAGSATTTSSLSSFKYFPGVPTSTAATSCTGGRSATPSTGRPARPAARHAAVAAASSRPRIRHHDGRFWLITTNVRGRRQLHRHRRRPRRPVVRSGLARPAGHRPRPGLGRRRQLLAAPSPGGAGLPHRPATGEVLEGPIALWSGHRRAYPEAPHLYRIGDWWYLLIAEGGTEPATPSRSPAARRPRGPFEPCPPTRSSPTAAPTGRSRPPATPTWSRPPTARGGWSCSASGRGPRRPSTCSAGRPSSRRSTGSTAGPSSARSTSCRRRPLAALRTGPVDRQSATTSTARPLAPYWISPRSRPDAGLVADRPARLAHPARDGPTLDRAGATIVGRRQQHHDCRVSRPRWTPAMARAGLTIRIDEAHHYDLEVCAGTGPVIGRLGPFRQVRGRPAPYRPGRSGWPSPPAPPTCSRRP